MDSNVTHLPARLRLVEAGRDAALEGKRLTYEPRKGVRELRCDTCHEIIRYGICGCTPRAA